LNHNKPNRQDGWKTAGNCGLPGTSWRRTLSERTQGRRSHPGDGRRAGLSGSRSGWEEGDIFMRRAVFVLVLLRVKSCTLRQSCTGNARSGRRTGIYIPRRSFKRAHEIIFASSWAILRNSLLAMAIVDMRHVNFWLPPDFRPNTQRTTSHHRGPAAAPTSQNQAVPLCNKAGHKPQDSSKSKAKTKSKSGGVTDRHGYGTRTIDDRIEAQGTYRTTCCGRAHLICYGNCSL
jgi:hypothetical protein